MVFAPFSCIAALRTVYIPKPIAMVAKIVLIILLKLL